MIITLSLHVSLSRTVFPDVVGYVQPIKDLILSEENVQVSSPLTTQLALYPQMTCSSSSSTPVPYLCFPSLFSPSLSSSSSSLSLPFPPPPPLKLILSFLKSKYCQLIAHLVFQYYLRYIRHQTH